MESMQLGLGIFMDQMGFDDLCCILHTAGTASEDNACTDPF